ncbi:MAG: protein kinase [Tepidisphaeraceae bacterium]
MSALIAIPISARKLTALGNETAQAVEDLYQRGQATLFQVDDHFQIGVVADAMTSTVPIWSDERAAEVIRAFAKAVSSGRQIDSQSLARWVRGHVNDAKAVQECMAVDPPEEIDIIKVLSNAGSQKLVFLATWRLTQQEVVLKQIIAQGESAERIMSRELQPHPLSMIHPNIIETHFLRNKHGERFLVERRIEPLNDRWLARGIHEAANLLFDIGRALKFLHDHSHVHGDVKPDNIGKRGTSYVLLDFGICRETSAFTRDSTPTGSLRTRAPELLSEGCYIEPQKADVWALGATVYKGVVGRFPLFKAGDSVPRISEMKERAEFEATLQNRVVKEWDAYVNLDEVPGPLRELLGQMLRKNPGSRISSADVLEKAATDLSAFLRSSSQVEGSNGRYSPFDEVAQLRAYFQSLGNNVSWIPRHRKQSLRETMKNLAATQGLGEDEQKSLRAMIESLE